MTIAQTAAHFDIGIASIVRWLKRLKPKRTRIRLWTRIDIHKLAQDIPDFPDAFHYERAQRLGVSTRGICTAMKRMGITYKTLKHRKADDAKRQCFQNKIEVYKAAGKPLIYLDESGFSNDMVRTHGYAEKGKRCYGIHDWGTKARTNVEVPCGVQAYW